MAEPHSLEYQWKRTRERMAKQGIGLLLVTEKFNYWLLTGHHSRQFDGKQRPMIMLLPLEKEPVMLVYGRDERAVRAAAPVKDVRTYVDVPFPLEMIPEAINELGLGAARIGCELGEFQRLGISYNDLCDVKKALPKAEFVDAASIFNFIRMVKTPQEVQYIKKACDLALKAWDIMLQRIHIGMHSSEVYRILQLAMFDVGGQGGHISLGLEGDAYSHTFQAGDWLWSDFGTQYKGYGSDLARMAIFGDPTDENKRDFDMIWELLRKLMGRIGPGVRCSDLARQTNEDMRKMGLKPLDAQKRIGHGFGVTSDPPSVGLADDTILEPGMVLTPEPRFFIASGQRMHIEEDVVVTEKGCDLLSTGAERLIVLK